MYFEGVENEESYVSAKMSIKGTGETLPICINRYTPYTFLPRNKKMNYFWNETPLECPQEKIQTDLQSQEWKDGYDSSWEKVDFIEVYVDKQQYVFKISDKKT